MVGGNIDLVVTVRGAEATDTLVDELDTLLAPLLAADKPRNSWLRFAIVDRKLLAQTYVSGDDWDLAIQLRALAALSIARTDLTFACALGPQLTFERDSRPCESRFEFELARGSYGSADAEIRSFLQTMTALPRPQLAGMFDRFTLVATADEPTCERFAEHFAREVEASNLAGVVHKPLPVYAKTATGFEVRGALCTCLELLEVTFVVMERAWLFASGLPGDSERVVRLELSGAGSLHIALDRPSQWRRFQHALYVGKGPARERHPASTAPHSEPRILQTVPDAARLLRGEELAWLSHSGETIVLEQDGTLRIVDEPRFTSADGRYGWFHYHLHNHAELRDLVTGAATTFPCDAIRLPYGFVGTSMLVTDRDEKTRVRLLHHDGTATDGEHFVGLYELRMLSDGRRAVFLARIDGEQRLVILDCATLAWTARTLWKPNMHASRLIAAPDGRVVVILGREDEVVDANTVPELHIAVLDDVERGDLRLAAKLPYCATRQLELAGETLRLVCTAPDANWETLFVTVELDTGAVETTSLPKGPERGMLAAIARAGDRTAVVYRGDGVYVMIDRDTMVKVLDRSDGDIAISPAGTIALLASDTLHLVRNGERIAIALPHGGGFLTWRTTPGMLYALPWL